MYNQENMGGLQKETPTSELFELIEILRKETTTYERLNETAYNIANTLKSFPPKEPEKGNGPSNTPQSLTELLYEQTERLRSRNDTYELIINHLRNSIGTSL